MHTNLRYLFSFFTIHESNYTHITILKVTCIINDMRLVKFTRLSMHCSRRKNPKIHIFNIFVPENLHQEINHSMNKFYILLSSSQQSEIQEFTSQLYIVLGPFSLNISLPKQFFSLICRVFHLYIVQYNKKSFCNTE